MAGPKLLVCDVLWSLQTSQSFSGSGSVLNDGGRPDPASSSFQGLARSPDCWGGRLSGDGTLLGCRHQVIQSFGFLSVPLTFDTYPFGLSVASWIYQIAQLMPIVVGFWIFETFCTIGLWCIKAFVLWDQIADLIRFTVQSVDQYSSTAFCHSLIFHNCSQWWWVPLSTCCQMCPSN